MMAWWALVYAFFGLASLLASLDQIENRAKTKGTAEAIGMVLFVSWGWPLSLLVCLFMRAYR